MDVTITARHCAVSESTRHQATEQIRRLLRVEPRAAAAQVRFGRDGGALQVETLVAVPGRPSAVSRASGATFRAALARAIERLERQLQRRRERRLQRRALARRTPLATADQ